MTDDQRQAMRATLLQFIVKWKEAFGLPAWAELSSEQALLCQNEWMASKEFGELYGWRLEPQNEGQRQVYDELRQKEAAFNEERRRATQEDVIRRLKDEIPL